MKRIQSAAVFQTVLFSQKPENGYSRDEAFKINNAEVEYYTQKMDRTRTRYKIVKREEQVDGSIILWVRKQYNDRIDVKEYFDL